MAQGSSKKVKTKNNKTTTLKCKTKRPSCKQNSEARLTACGTPADVWPLGLEYWIFKEEI